MRAIVALVVMLGACGGRSDGSDTIVVAPPSASFAPSSSNAVTPRAPDCVGAARVDACNAGERQVCIDASDLAFTACDFAEDELGVELAKKACALGAPRGCLVYGTLLFTRLPLPHNRAEDILGRDTLKGVCNAAKAGMQADEAEARRAACDRVSARLAAAGDAEWETYATKACDLGRVDACVRLAAKEKGPPYLAALTKLCLDVEPGDPKLIGTPLVERKGDPNRLLRVCVEVLKTRDATFELTAEGRAVQQRVQSLDIAGLRGYYFGTDPPPEADPATTQDHLANLGQAACSMGDDQACGWAPTGEPGSGRCTLLQAELCSKWANALLSPNNGLDESWNARAERIATRACFLDDRECGVLGRVLRVVRPTEVMRARDAFSRACSAGNSSACNEGDAR